MLKLSVLDQSPIPYGTSHAQAIQYTVQLAQHVEKLGYYRFWVSEHHDSNRLAGSSPEVLMAHLASQTSTIRIGSGGVMLPHYSAYKVAENFRTLEALFPNRIDLGVGRAPGGIPIATRALQEGKIKMVDRYAEQVSDLIRYVNDALEPEHRFAGLKTSPNVDTSPEIWLLGSSWESAQIAAEAGTSFAFAQFINGQGGAQPTKQYKTHFKPSIAQSSPRSAVAIHLICAETEQEANRRAASMDLSLLFMSQGVRFPGIPTIEQAEQYQYGPFDHEIIKENRKRMVVGDPSQVKQRLTELSEQYETDEFIIVTITHDIEHRLESFRLLAEAVLRP